MNKPLTPVSGDSSTDGSARHAFSLVDQRTNLKLSTIVWTVGSWRPSSRVLNTIWSTSFFAATKYDVECTRTEFPSGLFTLFDKRTELRIRVKPIDEVVRVVQKSHVPALESGAAIRQSYLDTVKDYRAVDTRQLAEYRRLPASADAELRAAVQETETRRYDARNAIAYDPLEELKATPVLATAIDNAPPCNDVAQWLDQSGFSDFGVGQCLSLTGNATLESFRLGDTEEVDCGAPHQLEVFVQTQHDAPVGAPYPGDQELGVVADQHCADAFAGYVGRDYDSSSFDYWVFYPDGQSWKANDREILCLLAPEDGTPTTGSAQGSGR